MSADVAQRGGVGAQFSPVFFELGITAQEVIDAWQDARLAGAIERTWRAAGGREGPAAFWCAGWGDFAFFWYVTDEMAALLDEAGVTWRRFVTRRSSWLPAAAIPFPPP